jgi:hypothetical protein
VAPVAFTQPIDAISPNTRKADDRKDDQNDSRVAPPPPRAALPPGQGIRIDQIA